MQIAQFCFAMIGSKWFPSLPCGEVVPTFSHLGGRIEFEISIPVEYPAMPPHVKCLTPILHPNIGTGVACYMSQSHRPMARSLFTIVTPCLTRRANENANDSPFVTCAICRIPRSLGR